MLQVFQRMLRVFHRHVASVFFKIFYLFQTYIASVFYLDVAHVSHMCCKSMIKMFQMF
jgi:hypothetical protein